MKVKIVLLIHSILAFLFGLGFLIMPEPILGMLSFAQSGDGPLAMRFAGIMIVGLSFLVFRARTFTEIQGLRVITLYLAVTYSMILIFHLILQLFFNVGSFMLWAVDVLHLVFAVYYWIFSFKAVDIN